jgi:predicted ATPase
MSLKRQVIGLALALALVPAVVHAQEKNGTIAAYDKESRMVTVKGKDWEQKAKVSSADAKDKAELLKEGTKVKVLFEDRGGGDVRVKSIEGR